MQAEPRGSGQRGALSAKGILILVAVAAVIAAYVFLVPRAVEKDLRDVLAEALAVERDDLVVNLPPRPQRYPGSILHTGLGLPVTLVDADADDLDPGPEYSLSARHEGLVKARGSLAAPVFEQVLENERLFQMNVTLSAGRTIEMTLRNLQARIASIAEGSPTERETCVIVRAHEAVLTLDLERRQDVSVQAWSSFLQELEGASLPLDDSEVEVGLDATSESHVEIRIPTRVVVGYEAARVSDVRTAAAGLLPDPVRLPEGAPDANAAVAALVALGPENILSLNQALHEIGPQAGRAAHAALRMAQQDGDPVKQQKILKVMQALPRPPAEALPDIEAVLEQPGASAELNLAASGVMLALRPDSTPALETMRRALEGSDAALRAEAAATIGRARLGNVELKPILRRADLDPALREATIRSIGRPRDEP